LGWPVAASDDGAAVGVADDDRATGVARNERMYSESFDRLRSGFAGP
jgi:hypothetical protein